MRGHRPGQLTLTRTFDLGLDRMRLGIMRCFRKASSVKGRLIGEFNRSGFSFEKRAFIASVSGNNITGTPIDNIPATGDFMFDYAWANPLFWDRKVKIAILTLATFAAMC